MTTEAKFVLTRTDHLAETRGGRRYICQLEQLEFLKYKYLNKREQKKLMNWIGCG